MTGYARGEADFAAAERYRRDARPGSLAPKDYSVPLHVDCSIEYELPDCAKPPQGVKIEPLLMIHPAHFRRLESLRRVPFVNNLPREAGAAAAVTAAAAAPRLRAGGAGAGGAAAGRRCCRQAAPAPAAAAAPPPQPAAAAAVTAAPARYRPPPAEPLAPQPAPGKTAAAAAGSRARLKAHPYLALDCDMARALPPPYERFDKRALQQLPIYM